MPNHPNEECRAVQVARAFFQAATKLSEDNEDILPQEDGVDQKLSVFHLFSELFPEYANDKDRDGGTTGKSGLMRLQFNKIGYEMYDKEQSRRVPAVRAKPGNPGYGFRRARWRDTMGNGEDQQACDTTLRALGVAQERLDRIRQRISDFREEWDQVRRPSRPAGPGRPRGHKRANPGDPMEAVDPMPEATGGGHGPGGAMCAGGGGAGARKVAVKKSCKTKPLMGAAAAKAAGMGGHGVAGVGVRGPGGHGAGWQPPQGAESPEDYVLQPAQGSDAAAGPVAAIVIDDEERAGTWQNVYHEQEQSPGGNGGGGPYDDEEESKHVHNLMDENSSLRSLNMSLIYEREKLLRELRQCDSEMVSMQRAVDGLLQTSATASPGRGESTLSLCQGFRWLCNKLVRRGRGQAPDAGEIPVHLRQVLEACFDKYDEFQRQSQLGGDEDDMGLVRAAHEGLPPLCLQSTPEADGSHLQDATQLRDLSDLAASKNGGMPSTVKNGSPSEDLREELTARGLQEGREVGKGVKEEPGRSDAMLGDGASSIGASPGLMAAAVGSLKKNRPSPVVSATKTGVIDGDSESVWVSGSVAPGLVGESEVEMYDGDIGEIGNYDYLFSSYCPATTAF